MFTNLLQKSVEQDSSGQENSLSSYFFKGAVNPDEEEEEYGAIDEFEEEEEDNEDEDLDEEEDDEDDDEDEDLDDDEESPRKQPYAVYSGEDEEEGDYALPYSVAR